MVELVLLVSLITPLFLYILYKPSIGVNILILIVHIQVLFTFFNIGDNYIKLMIEGILIFVFLSYLIRYKNKNKILINNVRITVVFLILIISLIMTLIHSSSQIINMLLYSRTFLYIFLLIKIGKHQHFKKIKTVIIISLILQIISSAIKIYLVGFSQEEIIGLMSYYQGALATIYPILIITVIFSLSLFNKNKKIFYYVMIILTSLIALASGKRAFWLYAPMFLILTYFLYIMLFKKEKINFKNIIILFVGSFIFLYFGSRLIPSLNPERKVWGGFSFEYIIEYIFNYNVKTSSDNLSIGRLSSTLRIFNSMYKNKSDFILGIGFDEFRIYEQSTDGALIFGVEYGLTGLTRTFIQIGLIGSILVTAIPLIIIIEAVKKIKNKTTEIKIKQLNFVLLILSMLFMFDFLTYSTSFINNIGPVVLLYYMFYGYVSSKNKQ